MILQSRKFSREKTSLWWDSPVESNNYKVYIVGVCIANAGGKRLFDNFNMTQHSYIQNIDPTLQQTNYNFDQFCL